MTQPIQPPGFGYRTEQDAVDALRPGWKITGSRPYTVDVDNPKYAPGDPTEPKTIKQTAGTTFSIQGPKGEPDEIILNQVPSADPAGGNIWTVVQGPQQKPTPQATPSTALTKLDSSGNVIPPGASTKPAVIRDDSTGSTFQVTGDSPTDPSTWTPIKNPNDPTQVIGLWDPANNKVGASVAQGNARPSGQYTNLIDPNDPAGKRVIGLVDTGDKSIHPVSTTADGRQIVTTPNEIFSYDKDSNTLTSLQKLDPTKALQVVTYPDGSIYTVDPNEKDPTKALTKLQGASPPRTLQQGNQTYVYNDATKSYELPAGITPAATVNNSTALKTLQWYDDKGNLVAEHDNPNYVATAPPQGSQSTTAPQIQQWNAKTGQWEWVPNQGRVTASQALKNMAQQLSGQVVNGDISQDEAIQIINASNAKMTNDINRQNAENERLKTSATAATGILNAQQNAAQTGAGLLNQRVQSATGALSNIFGQVAGSKIMNVPAGVGQGLVQGLQDWTTQLGGGQGVYDAAAQMVQNAAPNISGDPNMASQAYGALKGMLDLYKSQTGNDYPGTQPQAGAGPGPNGGIVAPTTQFNPQASTAAMNAAGFQDTPAGRAAAAAANPAVLQTPRPAVAQAQPLVANPTQRFVPPGGSSYSYPTSPWQPLPIPALPFQAPVTS